MIVSAKIFGVNRSGEIDQKVIDLWPRPRKAIRREADFSISNYYVEVYLERSVPSILVLLNGVESFPLVQVDEGVFLYRSNRFSSKSFLSGNLGLYEFSVRISENQYQLATIVNKEKNAFSKKSISSMYNQVAKSDYFDLFVASYRRANFNMGYSSDDSNQRNIWVEINIIRRLLTILDEYLRGEINFSSRVSSEAVVDKYSSRSNVSDTDLTWLLHNPDQLTPSSSGEVYSGGLRYSVNRIQQTKNVIDYNTYENRLLLSCLFSMRDHLYFQCLENEGNVVFPLFAVEGLAEEVAGKINSINGVFGLSPPFNEIPKFSNVFYHDLQRANLASTIMDWFVRKKIEVGSESRASVENITVIYEHYCFICIAKALLCLGFSQKDVHIDAEGSASKVTLVRRGDETIEIFYEPKIFPDSSSVFMSKNISVPLTPDFVLVYKVGDKSVVGVVDAKFSEEAVVRNQSGPKIYSQYGLYMHKDGAQPIDYVIAAYPGSSSKKFNFESARHSRKSNIRPHLGFMPIALPDFYEEVDLSNFLNSLIAMNEEEGSF